MWTQAPMFFCAPLRHRPACGESASDLARRVASDSYPPDDAPRHLRVQNYVVHQLAALLGVDGLPVFRDTYLRPFLEDV